MTQLINIYVLTLIFLIGLSLYTIFRLGKDIVTVWQARLFKMLIFMYCLYVVTAGLWSLMEYGMIDAPKWLFVLNSSLSYLSLALIAFWLFLFVMVRHDFEFLKKKLNQILSVVPVAIVLVLLIVSSFTGIIFYVKTGENGTHLVNGSLFPFMIISAMSYFFFILVASVAHAIITPSQLKKREYVALALSMVLIFISVLGLGVLFKYLTILPMAVFAVIYIVFTNLQESGINNDALTGLNNRRRANEYIHEQKESVSPLQPLMLFLCDVNSFKKINDLYGHLEGDRALMTTSATLGQVVSKYSGFLSRFGGDEFLFSIRNQALKADGKSPEDIVNFISEDLEERCKKEGKPYILTVSIGYVTCDDPKRPLGAYFAKADEMLYKVKEEYHKSMND